MSMVPHKLPVVVEGVMDEFVVRRIFVSCGLCISTAYGKNGKEWIRNHINAYNQAAKFSPWFILVDLDHSFGCAPDLINGWIVARQQLLIFRVAVREIEAWLLADIERMAHFLGVPKSKLPATPDMIVDPKQELIALARLSQKRTIREDLVPRPNSGRRVGPAYTSRLSEFVADEKNGWRPEKAAERSDSLARCLHALKYIKRHGNIRG